MVPYLLINSELLERTPQEVRDYIHLLRRHITTLEATDREKHIEELEGQIRALRTKIDELQQLLKTQHANIVHLKTELADAKAQLGTNSTNSSLPPSSNRFPIKRRPPKPSDQPRKKSGGQPGHLPHQRSLVPPESVSQRIPCIPKVCRRCRKPLTGTDPNPLRHQAAELPVVVPKVVEYQRHRLTCPCCHTSTCGTLPPGIQGHFGPRLEATLALLTGQYRLGLRPIVALSRDLWNLRISTGMICNLRRHSAEALFVPWREVALHVRTCNVNIDETGWPQGKKKGYVWAVVTPSAVLYKISQGRSAASAQRLLGQDYAGVATCDRLKSYWWIKRLQWCWSHLRRDFQAMIDRANAGVTYGKQLLSLSDKLFHQWHRFKDDKLSRSEFQESMKPIRRSVGRVLTHGTSCSCRKTAGTCKELLTNESRLWTFVDVSGVEPTNNTCEQVERPVVMLRKVSGGTKGRHGSRFLERILTVVESSRRQGKNVSDYLCSCITAWRHNRSPPSLLASAEELAPV